MKYFPLVLLLFVLFSCKKEKEVPPEEILPIISDPVVRERGNPLNEKITTTIGSDGGSLNYGNLVKIDVPAGAVEGPTLFGIQPINNTLDEPSGRMAYRLTPEGMTFKKPVKITFNRDFQQPDNPISRMIAFQRKDGVWCGVSTALDNNVNSVSTTTTHFSDWVWFDMITLRKDRETVGSGGTVKLKLMEQILGALNASNQIDSVPLAALEDIGRSKDILIKNWKIVRGPGSLEPKINSNVVLGDAIYTAPSNIRPGEEVEIQVEVESRSGYVSDPKAPHGKRKFGKLILLTQVQLEAETYLRVKVSGQAEDFSAEMYGGITNNEIHLGNVSLNGGIQLQLSCFGASGGSYPGGREVGQSLVGISFPSSQFKQNYYNLYLDCSGAYQTSGLTTVSMTEDHIVGSFTGRIYLNDSKPCGFTDSKDVQVDFKIKK